LEKTCSTGVELADEHKTVQKLMKIPSAAAVACPLYLSPPGQNCQIDVELSPDIASGIQSTIARATLFCPKIYVWKLTCRNFHDICPEKIFFPIIFFGGGGQLTLPRFLCLCLNYD